MFCIQEASKKSDLPLHRDVKKNPVSLRKAINFISSIIMSITSYAQAEPLEAVSSEWPVRPTATIQYDHIDHKSPNFHRSSKPRRIRLGVKTQDLGQIYGKVQWKFEDQKSKLHKAYIKWNMINKLSLTGGIFREPYSRFSLIPSKHLPLLTRPPHLRSVQLINPGIMLGFNKKSYSLMGGYFKQGKDGFKSPGTAFTGRAIYNPIRTENKIVSFGFSTAHRMGKEQHLKRSLFHTQDDTVNDRIKIRYQSLRQTSFDSVITYDKFYTILEQEKSDYSDVLRHKLKATTISESGIIGYTITGNPRTYQPKKGVLKSLEKAGSSEFIVGISQVRSEAKDLFNVHYSEFTIGMNVVLIDSVQLGGIYMHATDQGFSMNPSENESMRIRLQYIY